MASEYATITECICSGLSFRSRAMAGRAVLTMVASSVCMKKPNATSHSRAGREAEATGAGIMDCGVCRS